MALVQLRRLLILLLVGFCALWSNLALARAHTVRPGQTLSRIARRYRVSVQDLRAANRLRNDRVRPGQVLQIPSAGEIYVRRGETLSHVARRVHVSQADLTRTNRLRRGRPLRIGQRLLMPGFTPAERIDRDFGSPDVPGQATLVRRDERLQLQLVDAEGHVRREAMVALGHLMRRSDGDEGRPANARLLLLLAKLSNHFGGRVIRIVSGFREAGGRTRETSRHTQGRATDIRIQGVPNRTLWETCRRINHTGCGFYPRSTFVHVDARRARTQWVDWSGPGQRARYGTLRGPARRRRRLRMSRPRANDDLPLTVTIIEPDGTFSSFEDNQAVIDAHNHDDDDDDDDGDDEDGDGTDDRDGTEDRDISASFSRHTMPLGGMPLIRYR